MNKKRKHLSLGLGVPTILSVFIILCMCILSVLTYLNASSNVAGFEKEKSNVKAYYEADTKAKQIVNALKEKEAMNEIEKNYNVIFKTKDNTLFFHVIINENQRLSVKLNEQFEVIEWKNVRE